MSPRVYQCPQCGGSLAPDRFGRPPQCPYCGSTLAPEEPVITAEGFREAFREWNAPETHGFGATFSLGTDHWAPGPLLARGDVADVYAAARARRPSERVVAKVLRDPRDLPRFQAEWDILGAIHRSEVPGAASFAGRLPQPAAFGECGPGLFAGSRAMVFRRAHGFDRTFEEVRRAFPRGIESRASIWVWRRILETLSFLHSAGFCHGAVLPAHLLVQDGEHGVLLVGYGCAGRLGDVLRPFPSEQKPFYPAALSDSGRLSPALDIAMSARAVAFLLGGTAAGDLPPALPKRLAALLHRIGWEGVPANPSFSAWKLREDVGALATEEYGPPAFCPIPAPK